MKEEFDKELRELSPLLNYLKKEQQGDGFRVPKFYFDNLADKVIAEAKATEKLVIKAKKETPQYPTLLARLQDFVGELFRPRLALAFGSLLLIGVAAWFMLTSKKTETNGLETTASMTPSTNIEQLPISGEKDANIGDKTPIKRQKEAVSADITSNASRNDAPISHQNAIKLGETAAPRILAGKDELVHPESGLTEEELATYLEENMDENDSDDSDGSNNDL
jgi:hypothetical protein